jgi:hypothetical protein
MPCYGLAEHVLFAAGKRDMISLPPRLCVDAAQLARDRTLSPVAVEEKDGATSPPTTVPSPTNKDTRWLVSSGGPMRCDVVPDAGRLLIVNPETHVCIASVFPHLQLAC